MPTYLLRCGITLTPMTVNYMAAFNAADEAHRQVGDIIREYTPQAIPSDHIPRGLVEGTFYGFWETPLLPTGQPLEELRARLTDLYQPYSFTVTLDARRLETTAFKFLSKLWSTLIS